MTLNQWLKCGNMQENAVFHLQYMTKNVLVIMPEKGTRPLTGGPHLNVQFPHLCSLYSLVVMFVASTWMRDRGPKPECTVPPPLFTYVCGFHLDASWFTIRQRIYRHYWTFFNRNRYKFCWWMQPR